MSVAFFTLLERRILGYVHFRLGPNKNSLVGIGQPFNDLIKLFRKIDYNFSFSSIFIFFISPMVLVLIAILSWVIFCHTGSRIRIKYFFLGIITINGLVTFFFLFPGWVRGSFYSSLGGYRASAQCISYEGIFFFCLIAIIVLFFSFNIIDTKIIFSKASSVLVVLPLLFCWLLSVIAERNRSPFDFAEGERELVSGFNTEYGRGLFSIIFLREYIRILFYRFFSSFLIFGETGGFLPGLFVFLLLYVWIRTAYPRLRYDRLIVFSWKSLIFLITAIFIFISFLIFF